MLFFVLIFIPQKELKKIFWFSVLWGTGLDLVVILLCKSLNLYHYVNADPFNFYGSPILINLSWAPAVMLFIYFLPARKEKYILPLYLSIYATLGVFIGAFLTKTGLIVETHWNVLLRFPLVYGCFYVCYKHYQYLKKKDRETI
jgi:hypothetical protein